MKMTLPQLDSPLFPVFWLEDSRDRGFFLVSRDLELTVLWGSSDFLTWHKDQMAEYRHEFLACGRLLYHEPSGALVANSSIWLPEMRERSIEEWAYFLGTSWAIEETAKRWGLLKVSE